MWLRIRIIAAFAVCAVVPMVVGTAAVWFGSAYVLGDAERRALQTNTQSAAAAIEQRFALDLADLKAWGALPVMQDALIGDDGGDIARAIADLKAQYPDFADLFVTDARGVVIAATSKDDLRLNLADDEGFRMAASGRAYQSAYGFHRADAPETIRFAVPLIASYDRQSVVGTLSGVLNVGAAVKAAIAQSPIASSAQALVVSARADGRAVFAPRPDAALLQALGTIEDRHAGGTSDITLRNVTHTVASVPSKGKGLPQDPEFIVRGIAPASDAYAGADLLAGIVLTIAFAAAAGALGYAWWWSTPLVRLGAAMTRLARGDTTVRAPETMSRDTFDSMTRAFETFRQTKSVHDWLAVRERELQGAKDGADRAFLEKSEHLASLARVLKGQLSTIVEMSEAISIETLKAAASGKRGDTRAQDISRCAMQLLGVINDLFDLSEAEAGHSVMRAGAVDLGVLVRESVDVMSDAAEKAKVSLGCDGCNGAITARVDAQKMKQVMFNLLSNAVKFTPQGGRVRATLKINADGGPTIVVEDTGVGMPSNLPPIAAAPFSAVDDAHAHGRHGAGLGLPLVRRLVALHGGAITFESEEGKGTTVTVTLPADRLVAREDEAERRIA